MSAAVCGTKRSFFEELPSSSSPPISKRHRCSSTSPVSFSPPSLIDQLCAVFPQLDVQLLERALEECGNDFDAAIKSVNKLCLGSTEESSVQVQEPEANVDQGVLPIGGDTCPIENPSGPSNLPVEGREWVDLFVNELMSASSVDDARTRASRVLEILEKSIIARAGAEAANTLNKENMQLKEQIEVLLRDNTILKKAVAIQHERHVEYEHSKQELQHLKQLVSQYQEQLRTLEVNNYALTMYLKQAQSSNSFPGRFHPDVF